MTDKKHDMRDGKHVSATNTDSKMAGGEDRIHPPGTVQRIADLYGDLATFEKQSGMSHWLIGEPGWEKVADRSLAWLETV